VIVGRLLYLVSDEGVAACLDALTGEFVWRKRLGGSYRASAVCARDRLYFFNLEGQATVLSAKRHFELLAVNTLDHGCQASPAIVGNALLMRTTRHLYCIE
jgi:outer membrane protein assembly factor BamB